ncbi:hypothetical protein GW17_00028814 [Ensete ventricosum]|nr:hypothetical protein GW17_00028814 [Ensete ventricosum]
MRNRASHLRDLRLLHRVRSFLAAIELAHRRFASTTAPQGASASLHGSSGAASVAPSVLVRRQPWSAANTVGTSCRSLFTGSIHSRYPAVDTPWAFLTTEPPPRGHHALTSVVRRTTLQRVTVEGVLSYKPANAMPPLRAVVAIPQRPATICDQRDRSLATSTVTWKMPTTMLQPASPSTKVGSSLRPTTTYMAATHLSCLFIKRDPKVATIVRPLRYLRSYNRVSSSFYILDVFLVNLYFTNSLPCREC